MDNEVIFSVAGSGKTSYLINKLNLKQNFLIIVYTKSNLENIKQRIVHKFGFIPPNIVCFSYFSFLYSWGVKPFSIQNYPKITKIEFDKQPAERICKRNTRYFIHNGAIYHNRFYDFLKYVGLNHKLLLRIELFFHVVLIDEVQDFAGHDFDFLMDLSKSKKLSLCYVGDFYQHTYDTSQL